MPAKLMSLDEFLEHSGSSGSSGSILKWREDGYIDVLLHPKAPFVALWSHTWFTVVKDRETGQDKILFTRFNSYEDEDAVLKKQSQRGDEGEFQVQYPWHDKPVSYYGARKAPPQICPFSLFLEWLREQIDGTKTISWLDRVFDIDTDKGGDENSQVLHAGGVCNLLRADDLDDDEKAAVRKAGIKLNEAYKESLSARMQYIGCVVPYKKPSEGPTLFIEAEALGKAFKKHILDLRDDRKDPRTSPVVFRWKYDESKSFSAKYDVSVRTSDAITDDHLAALAKPYPEEKLQHLVADSNLVELRKTMERWWCHKVVPPWDAIFGPAMKAHAGKDVTKDPESFDPDEESDSADAGGDEDYECSNPDCKAPMKGTDMTCGKCGAVYDADGNWSLPPKNEDPPKRKGRSAASRSS